MENYVAWSDLTLTLYFKVKRRSYINNFLNIGMRALDCIRH